MEDAIERLLLYLAARLSGLIIILCLTTPHAPGADRLVFTEKFGQVEVGGPFAGAEFHKSRPLPSRISFYYPVANSIDLSTGYWERGESAPLTLGVSVDSGAVIPLGLGGWEYALSPHTVTFRSANDTMRCSIRYEFCLTEPALAVTYTIANSSPHARTFDVRTQAAMILRTCQTYARKVSPITAVESPSSAVIARFNDADTDSTSVFIVNAGAPPYDITVQAGGMRAGGSSPHADTAASPPVCEFRYAGRLQPGDSLVIVQLIGSCRNAETPRVVQRVRSRWRSDVDAYDAYVHQTIDTYAISTGDPVLDRSVGWSAAMLAANRHYIDGVIVPMPCPAEYNFYFTHDVLLTDLGAVHYDRERVKRDLAYITSHARDTVIPHAYYWRDDGMKTEYCPPDNWNHLWFILASASYIRHTQDDSAAARLFPFVKKSLAMILTQKKADGLLYAKHPDWWDIGSLEGPRAYITALTVRAIGEYCSLASSLGGSDAGALRSLERAADTMKTMLVKKLWDPQLNYLINYNGTDKDRHIYAGSLVAGAYGVLGREMSLRMAETARRTIVDSLLGVRTVSPTDFHTDSVIAYFHLAGNEAGAPFVYANGGIWPHTTSWYIWVLNAAGKKDEAAAFLKTTLSVDGIMASPMGQPAMFEYRFADPASPRYGEIDKPTFMWAAGFFLQSLYRVYGISDNEWNISIGLRPHSAAAASRFPFVFGNMRGAGGANAVIVTQGSGECIQSLRIGGRAVPSAVIPLDAVGDSISVGYGPCTSPYLESVNAVVHSAEETRNGISVTLSSFEGHRTQARFLCVKPPRRILVDGRAVRASRQKDGRGVIVDVAYTAGAGRQTMRLQF